MSISDPVFRIEDVINNQPSMTVRVCVLVRACVCVQVCVCLKNTQVKMY